MHENKIYLTSLNETGTKLTLEANVDENSNLMEFLVNNDFDIPATCGGMALCGTCCINIVSGGEKLPPPVEDENLMLDSLPRSTVSSRLCCQIKLRKNLDGLIFELNPDY